MFTIANPTAQDIAKLKTIKCQFIIFQGETGKGGLNHIQGFVQFKTRKRLSWMKKNFHKKAHFEQRKGTVKQAMDYPAKDDTYNPAVCERYQSGEPIFEKKVGRKKTATTKLAEDIISEKIQTAREAMLADPGLYLRSRTNILGMINDVKGDKKRESHRLIVIWGDSGSGKTYTAKDWLDIEYPGQWQQCSVDLSDYVQNGSPKAVLLEEFSGNIELNLFKQLFDPAAKAPKIKQRYFNGNYTAECTVITSNRHPGTWYSFKSQADAKAVYRRIDKALEYKGEFVSDFDTDVTITDHPTGGVGMQPWFSDVAWTATSPSFVVL